MGNRVSVNVREVAKVHRVLLFLCLSLVVNGATSQSSERVALGAERSALQLFELIERRLSLMQDVARYKTKHQLPVEDRQREILVLKKAGNGARRSGLSEKSVKNFFRLQIAAAKAIQYRYRANGLFSADKSGGEESVRDLSEIREQLLSLGGQINQSLLDHLSAGFGFNKQLQAVFLRSVDVHYLKDAEKRAMYQALQQIRLR